MSLGVLKGILTAHVYVAEEKFPFARLRVFVCVCVYGATTGKSGEIHYEERTHLLECPTRKAAAAKAIFC